MSHNYHISACPCMTDCFDGCENCPNSVCTCKVSFKVFLSYFLKLKKEDGVYAIKHANTPPTHFFRIWTKTKTTKSADLKSERSFMNVLTIALMKLRKRVKVDYFFQFSKFKMIISPPTHLVLECIGVV